ncbi:MAG: folylpolyglutamate synthase/dihydrofolate synthase family protein [Candidatus Thermoplasmatota archaeon]|nr:folylpolyglutamate synthase/dihydrofolate synthase family protein [Candidatus Thermoplasmatota archaeon]
MDCNETLNWLYDFQKFGINLGLKRIGYISKELGNPHKNYKVIHVGGTNGKGSVCRFLESILTSAGYKVGVYTSPHLQHISERIMIGNKRISDEKLVSLAHNVKPIINMMVKNNDPPTFFEIITAMAFQYFSDENVDFAVMEVGLGGRYDATNIVDPMVSIITNVSLDHQNILGKNVKDIASEKAGIIKNNVPIVTAAKEDSLKIIENVANDRNAPIYQVEDKKWKRLNHNQGGQEFYINGSLKDYSVRTQMLGEHHGENIALTIAAIENLQMSGVYIIDTNILDGIEKTFNPGRMEIVGYNPVILLDGAHNKAGMESLGDSIKNDFEYDKLTLVLGILSDKDILSMLPTIVPLADIIITTKSNNNRACEPSDLKGMITKVDNKKKVVVKEKIKDAIDYAKSISKKKDLICITGSLFTVGEAKDYLVP